MRHHKEGVSQAGSLFGEQGARAAEVHILRDCRQVPQQADYETGYVDALGLRREWPVTAYIKYTDEDFEDFDLLWLLGRNLDRSTLPETCRELLDSKGSRERFGCDVLDGEEGSPFVEFFASTQGPGWDHQAKVPRGLVVLRTEGL